MSSKIEINCSSCKICFYLENLQGYKQYNVPKIYEGDYRIDVIISGAVIPLIYKSEESYLEGLSRLEILFDKNS